MDSEGGSWRKVVKKFYPTSSLRQISTGDVMYNRVLQLTLLCGVGKSC